MYLLSRLYILCLLFPALTGCARVVIPAEGSTLSSTPDSDAVKLVAMSEGAVQIAQKESPDVVLRQVDSDLTITDFRFVDKTLTKEIMVVVPEPNASIDQWHTDVNSVSPLLTHVEPAIDQHSLRVGPNRVAQAITAYWSGCLLKGMTLYLENDKLTWVAFCNTPQGDMSGTMDNQTGIFKPAGSLPAPVPLTATPAH